MSSKDFLTNQRRVMRAAYEYAGYDPDQHVSSVFSLGKKTSRSEPFRIPLNATLLRTFNPQPVNGVKKRNAEISFIPIDEDPQSSQPNLQPINGDYYYSSSSSSLFLLLLLNLHFKTRILSSFHFHLRQTGFSSAL